MRWFSEYKNIALLCIFGVAVFLSFFCFQTSPHFWFDEGIFYQVVKNWAFSGVQGVELSPGGFSDFSLISVGYSVFYPAILAFQVFGDSIITLRGVAITFLFLCILSFYILTRKIYGIRVALLSTALLVTFSPLYGNGKSFLGEVPGIFFLFLGIYVLFLLEQAIQNAHGLRTSKLVLLALITGTIFGFSIVAKPLFLVVLPALAVGILFRWKLFLKTVPGRHALIAGFIGLLLSLGVWFFTQFELGTSVSGVFAHYANPYYLDEFLPIIVDNLKRFFTESTPLLFLLQFILAVYYVIRKIIKKHQVSSGEITALIFVALVGAAYLRTVGWYRYFFPGHVVLFLFTVPAIGLIFEDFAMVAQRFQHKGFLRIFKHQNYLQFATVLLFVFVQIIPLSKNALSCTIDAPTMAMPYVQGLDTVKPVLFYSVPQLAAHYSGEAGYQFIKMSDSLQLGNEQAARLQEDFFHTVFIEAGTAAKGNVLPTCFERKEIIGSIEMYTRNTNVSCRD